jgi:hypothetical protein
LRASSIKPSLTISLIVLPSVTDVTSSHNGIPYTIN